MAHDKPVKMEIIPSPARILQTQVDEILLEKLVQQKVAEIMTARDQFIFEPFFRTRQVAYEIRRLQTVPEQNKWSVWYRRYGCMVCKEQDKPHAFNGMDARCSGTIRAQLSRIIRELMNDPRSL